MTITLLPSVEKVMISFLNSKPEVTAITGSRIGTRLGSTLPAIRLTRIGNSVPESWRDEAGVQVECWAEDQATADLLARTVVAALPDIRHTAVAGGGRVHSYTITSGPFWSPDDQNLTGNPRYLLTADLLITT